MRILDKIFPTSNTSSNEIKTTGIIVILTNKLFSRFLLWRLFYVKLLPLAKYPGRLSWGQQIKFPQQWCFHYSLLRRYDLLLRNRISINDCQTENLNIIHLNVTDGLRDFRQRCSKRKNAFSPFESVSFLNNQGFPRDFLPVSCQLILKCW